MFKRNLKVKKSILIKKNITEIKNILGDFNTWPKWLSWLAQDLQLEHQNIGNTLSEGQKQQWSGPTLGAGFIKTKSIKNNSFKYQMNLLKKNYLIEFLLKEREEGVMLTCALNFNLSFIEKLYKQKLEMQARADITRSLKMLKELCEDNKVSSEIKILGEQEVKEFYYIGIKRYCPIEAMGRLMADDYLELQRLVEKDLLTAPEKKICVHHQYDLKSKGCEYTAAYLYHEIPEKTAGLFVMKVKEHKAFVISHEGSFTHLPNAWASMLSHISAKIFRLDKSIEMYQGFDEFYLDEDKVSETTLYAPLKA